MKVLQFPLTRITCGLIIGILFAYYVKPDFVFVSIFLIVAISFFVLAFFVSKRELANPMYFGLSTCFLSFGIGISTQVINTDSYHKTNYCNSHSIFDKQHLVRVTIREKLKFSNYNDRYIVVVNQIDDVTKTGNAILNIKKDSVNPPFEVGTHLQLNTLLYKNSVPKNPMQFDYSAYLKRNQIFAQIYTKTSDLKIGSEITKDLWYYTAKLRTRIIQNLEKNHFKKSELGVAAALLLGQKQEISPEILQDYQYAGAIHILAVSGLHVGIILLFLNFLLKPIPNTRRGSFIKLTIVLLSLISFAIIAGLSPSVLRSVTMFSFVAIGMYLRRSTYIYHTLLVSALLILLFKPSFLFEVGFQLSYLALFFILWLQPLLAQMWAPKNKIINYFWDILTVSFAAQIGVLPLSIYYFHQFPGLFFVTNLAVIPFLSLLMPLGVVVMVLAAFDSVPLFLSKTLEWGILIMNKVINWIASFEQFIIQEIPFNWQFLLSIYFLIFTSIIWFKKPSFHKLTLALIAILTLQLTYFSTYWTVHNQKELIVFNSKKSSLIAEKNGDNVTIYTSQNQLKTIATNKTVSAYLMGNFSHLTAKKELKNLLYFNNTKIFILDSLGLYPSHIRPDILLLIHSPKINLERMLQTIRPKIVVADATNFKTVQKVWASTCMKLKIPFHATDEKGFYKLN